MPLTWIKVFITDNILVFNNDPDNDVVTVPVTLVVIDPPALEVNPESIESVVFVGTSQDHAMTISNTGEANLRFGFAGFGDAPEAGVFTQKPVSLSPAQLEKLARDQRASVEQSSVQPIRFMEGEEILFEDFEGASFPPAGWTVLDNEGNGVIWGASDENYTGASGNSAFVNSDAAPFVEYDTELRTPAIDVEGRSGVAVEYYANYQDVSTQDLLELDISTDGGANWTTVLSWNEDHGSLFDLPGEFVSLELDEYIEGASTMMLRWHYYNPGSGDWDWYANIDDVKIIYEGIQWLSVAPGQGVLGAGESMDVTVTFDATAVEPGTYTQEMLLLTKRSF